MYFVDGKCKVLNENHYVLQQFAGLLDKNGKEIYEGDIVEYSRSYPIDDEDWLESKKRGQIIWKESDYGKKLGFEIVSDSGESDFYGSWPESEFIEVVGNIFNG